MGQAVSLGRSKNLRMSQLGSLWGVAALAYLLLQFPDDLLDRLPRHLVGVDPVQLAVTANPRADFVMVGGHHRIYAQSCGLPIDVAQSDRRRCAIDLI